MKINTKLKKYCEGKRFIFVKNNNINESGLNNSKLHLNKKGTMIFSQNIKRPLHHFRTSFDKQKNVDITSHFLRDDNDIRQILNTLRNKNSSNIKFCYLNINSMRNKFSDLQEVFNGNFDIVSIAETKIDAFFPSAQFVLDGYHQPYCMDVTEQKGGILVYVKSLILSHRLTC